MCHHILVVLIECIFINYITTFNIVRFSITGIYYDIFLIIENRFQVVNSYIKEETHP